MNEVQAVRALIRSGGRAPMSWSDRYVALFGLAMAGAVLAQPVASALATMAGQADPSRLGAGVALIALAYAGFLALARTLGPVALPAADAAWLLLSPLPRRAVLGRSAVILLAISSLAGAGLGLALLAVLGAPDQLTPRLVTAVLLGVSAAVGGMATAVLAQSSQHWDSWLQGALVVLAIVAALATVLGSGPGRHLLVAVADAPVSLGAASVALCGTVTALLVRRAWAALGRVHARTVLAASTRAGGVAAATVVLEFGALTWIAEDGHWRGRTLRSRPWPAPLSGALSGALSWPMPRLLRPLSAPLALAWQDWRRLGRRPGRLAALLAAAALPALAAQAAGGLSPVAMILVAGGALTAAAACTTGARRDGEDPSLARLFGVGARAALTARALLPMLLSAVWLTLALAGLTAMGALPAGPWWLFGPLSAPALAAGALRMARRGFVDHSMPVIDTPMGSVPMGPLVWAMTGVDIAVLGCAPALLAPAAGPSALGALVVAQALSGAAVLTAFLLRARRAAADPARLG
ncbi:DUF6297 family protein [Streptosporangium sp. NPDC006013]|uniref:DUF6297 family protein n=1 Tax=Streptosporangium sp. NPDC006013 TaxID=3155596 RepID=UPI0033A8B266